ncbi:hypothetical protein PR202_gb12360 [Eleusine coracana subsp. coracana]|uniref:Uncharacterized protein n=1 Tax=Eleusine coracana subsp. coracana TaxID=191504 RepID=A0AAV5EMV1_ELECO|nr:hypothetical protein PR202_gb12360 [Eleusine coracana subsp. coracana]
MNPELNIEVENVALPYIVYSEYVLFGNERTVHEDDAVSFEQFKQLNKMLIAQVIAEEDGLQVLPGENEPLIRYVLAKEFNQQLRRNYMSAHSIISNMFSDDIPADIEDLLKLIEKDKARELYHIHGSLVPIGTRSALFKRLYDYIRFEIPLDDLRYILEKLPYVESWKTDIDTNHLLRKTYDHNDSIAYEVPENTEQGLSREQIVLLGHLGLQPKVDQESLEEDQIKLIKALQFFDYLRNRTTHGLEPLRDWIKEHNVAFNAEGSELVSHVRFPLVIPYLQRKLLKKNKLLEAKIKKFF